VRQVQRQGGNAILDLVKNRRHLSFPPRYRVTRDA
jgi:hypothetical protein